MMIENDFHDAEDIAGRVQILHNLVCNGIGRYYKA
jgi:hypothetical protein